MNSKTLGINGLGRIGKLTLWYHLYQRYFNNIVVNLGRSVGRSLEDIIQVVENDSSYGRLASFLGGFNNKSEIKIIDKANKVIEIAGIQIKFLCDKRNPSELNWRKEGVRLVVDTTGKFCDPTSSYIDNEKGNLRGHLEAGAEKVINSAPFKIKDAAASVPDDSIMLIYGINHTLFNTRKHNVISAASCTTTALSHMVKPLLETPETSNILTASMSTIHAATNTQSVLDSVPKAAASDLRKNRAAFNNIILSTTGAADALGKVLPEIQRIGFMADSVRIPIDTVSLINLNLTFHSPLNDNGSPEVFQNLINDIYRKASEGPQKGILIYSDKQNVSSDIKGLPAAVVIEGHENHTRTGFIDIPSIALEKAGIHIDHPLRVPVTHAKIFGWYDNEFGSYTHLLGQLSIYINKMMG